MCVCVRPLAEYTIDRNKTNNTSTAKKRRQQPALTIHTTPPQTPSFSLFTLTLAPTSVKISIAHSCFNTHPFVKRQPYPSSSHHQHPFSSFICPKHITTITKQHFGIFTITTTNFKSTGSGSETVGYSAHRSHRSFWHFSHYG